AGAIYDVNATPTTGTLSYRARVVMPNPDDALRGGMLVSVAVRTRYAPHAIVVPITAVVQGATGAAARRWKAEFPARGSDVCAGEARAGHRGTSDRHAGTNLESADYGGYDDHHDAAGLASGQENGGVFARWGPERHSGPVGRFTHNDSTDFIGAERIDGITHAGGPGVVRADRFSVGSNAGRSAGQNGCAHADARPVRFPGARGDIRTGVVAVTDL